MRRAVAPLVALSVLIGAGPSAAAVPAGSEFLANSTVMGDQTFPAVAGNGSGRFVAVWTASDANLTGVFGRRFAADGSFVGSEFPVNVFTTGNQGLPSVAMAPDGSFVVVWQSAGQDGFGSGIFGRRFDASGMPGSEFQVNTSSCAAMCPDQELPDIGVDADGDAVVTWQSRGQDSSGPDLGVFAQRYTLTGSLLVPSGSEFRINSGNCAAPDGCVGDQREPAVAVAPDGRFTIVWTGLGQEPGATQTDVFGRRFQANGAPAGSEFRANSATCGMTGCTGDQDSPDVAADADGDFVVAWEASGGQDGSDNGVYGQRYAAAGSSLGAEFRANTHTMFDQEQPAIASAPDGRFAIVWQSFGQDSSMSDYGIFGQGFAADGAAKGQEFRVNLGTCAEMNGCVGDQDTPAIAGIGTDAGHVVTWESAAQDSSGEGIFGQRYAWEPATATTQPATAITPTSATLNGLVNPEGGAASFRFDYGTTTGYELGSTTEQPAGGLAEQAVSAPLSGLAPETTYHFRAVALRGGATFAGQDATFTTAAAPVVDDVDPPDAPVLGKRKQDVDKLVLLVTADEAATLTGTGTVALGKTKKRLRFRPVTATVAAGEQAKLRFRLAKRAAKKVKAAIADGAKPKAKLSVSARDAAGNQSTANRTVTLKD